MKDFNKLCKEVEALDPLEYATVITAKTAKIMPDLRAVSDEPADSVALFATFLIASVYADGKLDEAEYLLMQPMLKLFFGEDFDYERAKAAVKKFRAEGDELKRTANDLIYLLGLFSEELKNDIITVCLLICAVDGKITLKEKKYIMQLIK